MSEEYQEMPINGSIQHLCKIIRDNFELYSMDKWHLKRVEEFAKEQKTPWIPVSERLPEKDTGQKFDIWLKSNVRVINVQFNGYFYIFDTTIIDPCEVSHYMLSPEKPIN